MTHIDWDAVYRVYRPRVNASTSNEALWALLDEVAVLLNDVHITLSDPTSDRRVRSGGRSIGVGPFDMHIGRFRDPDASAQATDAAIAALKGAKGFVLDVRHNDGGDDRVGQAIASRFVVASQPYMTVEMRRIGRVPAAFLDPVEWRLTPAGPVQYTRPVVLLVNSRSISAAENFAIAMRTVPHATIVGETTAGVMADVVTKTLPNGWLVTVPINVFRDTHGASWEGIGITPDLWVKNDPAAVASGTDRGPQVALDFLRAGAVRPRDRAQQRRVSAADPAR